MVDRKKQVLVVDDDPDLLEMFEMLLDACDIEVVVATNGVEALELIQKGAPDLIFLDIRMPVMDGKEFARHLRERNGVRVPIVVFTASVDPKLKAQEIGAEDFLTKPFDLGDLLDKIQRHLGVSPIA